VEMPALACLYEHNTFDSRCERLSLTTAIGPAEGGKHEHNS